MLCLVVRSESSWPFFLPTSTMTLRFPPLRFHLFFPSHNTCRARASSARIRVWLYSHIMCAAGTNSRPPGRVSTCLPVQKHCRGAGTLKASNSFPLRSPFISSFSDINSHLTTRSQFVYTPRPSRFSSLAFDHDQITPPFIDFWSNFHVPQVQTLASPSGSAGHSPRCPQWRPFVLSHS